MVKIKENLVVLGGESYATPFKAVWPRNKIKHLPTNTGKWEPNEVLHEDIKAVMFTGGADVHPSMYREENIHPRTMSNLERDLQEKRIFNYCLANDIPMFGICRGSQFLAVMCGHSLHQHIEHHGISGTHLVYPLHRARDGENALLRDSSLPQPPFEVTSTHHQAVACPGGVAVTPKLRVLLMGESRQISAVEGWCGNGQYTRIAAVQYHPEYMAKDSDGFRYYADLIRSVVGKPTKHFNPV